VEDRRDHQAGGSHVQRRTERADPFGHGSGEQDELDEQADHDQPRPANPQLGEAAEVAAQAGTS
jgi:hypothetical protein